MKKIKGIDGYSVRCEQLKEKMIWKCFIKKKKRIKKNACLTYLAQSLQLIWYLLCFASFATGKLQLFFNVWDLKVFVSNVVTFESVIVRCECPVLPNLFVSGQLGICIDELHSSLVLEIDTQLLDVISFYS